MNRRSMAPFGRIFWHLKTNLPLTSITTRGIRRRNSKSESDLVFLCISLTHTRSVFGAHAFKLIIYNHAIQQLTRGPSATFKGRCAKGGCSRAIMKWCYNNHHDVYKPTCRCILIFTFLLRHCDGTHVRAMKVNSSVSHLLRTTTLGAF